MFGFISAPDFENDPTSYSITITASDGVNSTDQNITISVNNISDSAPEITSSASFSADENQTAIGTVTATDSDGDTITFSISGAEIGINANTGSTNLCRGTRLLKPSHPIAQQSQLRMAPTRLHKTLLLPSIISMTTRQPLHQALPSPPMKTKQLLAPLPQLMLMRMH